MAMNAEALGKDLAEIVTADNASEEGKKMVLGYWTKIAGVIIGHIQQNAEVPAGIPLKASGAAGAVEGATTAPGQIK